MEEKKLRNLMIKAASWAQAHKSREEGQGVVEYALVIGGVSVILIGVLSVAGTGWINSVTAEVTAALA
jgi:Flp pilus assembly pilin Flp